jgi:pimeloyl-ACP methyl ester carboxylesterase
MDWPTIWRGIRMQIGTLRSRRRAFLEIVLTKPEHQTGDLDHIARSLEPLFGHDLGVTPAIAMRQVRAMSRWNVLARLADLKSIPTLVVGATHDLIARRELVRATAAAIPGAKLVELEGAAHGVPVTAPDTVTGLLRDHLGEVEARMAGRRVH